VKRLARVVIASVVACHPAAELPPPASLGQGSVDWVAYGRDPGGSRYAPIDDISRDNVSRLRVAWTYRTREIDSAFATRRETSLEATPLVVDGTMYLATPLGRVIALDPATGAERWVFDPRVDRNINFGDFTNRGVSTWVNTATRPTERCHRRIFVAVIDARLIALDARDGRPCADFGTNGTVDLRAGLRNPPFETAEYEVTSPPAVVGGLVVIGSAVADNNRVDAASGEVRAFDARTGALRWTWDPVPQRATDPAYATWRGERAHTTGAANAWSVIAADTARGLVFVPTGSPSPDYYGGGRLGDNRYANSVVALRAATGEVAWHFQTIHHDLWDYDNAAPPALTTIRMSGRDVDVVVQATKSGMMFVLDRATGAPVFPVEERRVPRSTVPGEEASPTQPFTVRTPPLSPHSFRLDDVWGATPADRDACLEAIAPLRSEGIFTPPSLEGTLIIPSNIGGAHWGGVAIDPSRQLAIVPVNRLAAMVQLIPAERLNADSMRMARERFGFEYTRMRGTPYVMRRRILRAPSGLPCSPPPFGTLIAVSLASGERIWEVPLGTVSALAGDRVPVPPSWGSPTLGGPIATAGGLVFIAATLDRSIRAFDVDTGREVWRGDLPASGKATPMTYRVNGKQYVVVSAGGGGVWGRGDWVVAFALP
jgi:quinoprotein glucose dehydrogenase